MKRGCLIEKAASFFKGEDRMGKALYIAEKPSVAQEFAKALKENMSRHDGYQESDHSIITWCVGHLVTMSYPEVYDPALKRWNLASLPFIPDEFLYEIIPAVKNSFRLLRSFSIAVMWMSSISVPTPGVKESIFTVWLPRWQE